jgi:hypothetical protein
VEPRWLIPLVCALAGGCDSKVDHNKPVGTTVDSDAQIERYLRRATLDLSGGNPTDAELADGLGQLRAADNTAAARATFVDGLLGRDTFATVWVGELENTIFGGNTLDRQYTLVCSLVRGGTAGCMTCTNADPCTCSCPQLAALGTERTQLRTSMTDLMSGTRSSVIEQRYAMATGYFALSTSLEARVKQLFDDFLARTAEADEVENGRAMIFGSLLPGSPAGLLFHETGASYADMIKIIFHSEVYREALVRRVFDRYLARAPSSVELEHFTATLDATDPDMRGLLRAVLSSREYFAQ